MTTQYSPPPTYAEVVLVDETTGRSRFNPIWLKWFLDLAQQLGAAGAGGGGLGTVKSVSVVATNGFSATVATPTTTPAITMSVTANGILQSNGTAISAATAISGIPLTGTTVQCSNANGFKSSDSSTGINASVTTGSLVGKTLTFKDGICTGFA